MALQGAEGATLDKLVARDLTPRELKQNRMLEEYAVGYEIEFNNADYTFVAIASVGTDGEFILYHQARGNWRDYAIDDILEREFGNAAVIFATVRPPSASVRYKDPEKIQAPHAHSRITYAYKINTLRLTQARVAAMAERLARHFDRISITVTYQNVPRELYKNSGLPAGKLQGHTHALL